MVQPATVNKPLMSSDDSQILFFESAGWHSYHTGHSVIPYEEVLLLLAEHNLCRRTFFHQFSAEKFDRIHS